MTFRNKLVDGVSWTLTLLPLAFFLLAASAALHVRIGLGHWPVPMFENYGTRAFNLHVGLVTWVGFAAVFVGIPLWLFVFGFQQSKWPSRSLFTQLGLWSGGWVAFLVFFACNPGDFVTWFLD